MTSLLHRAAAGGAIAFFVVLGAARADEERELFDTELAIVKKRVRIPEDVAEVERYLRPRMKEMEVEFEIAPAPLETTTRVPLPDGKPSPIELRRLDLRGTKGLGDVQLLFAFATNPFIYEIESLRLTPRPGNQVAFQARIAVARWAGEAPYVLGTYHDPASAIHGRLLELRAIAATIDALEERFRPRRLLNAIGMFANAIQGKAIALTEMRAGQETRIDGMLLGAAARAALKPALETSGFDVAKLDFAPRGDCQAFTATLRLQPRDQENTFGGPTFDADVASVCTPKPAAPAARVAARGNGGKVTMHLRGVDAADVFLALNAATREAFVVDGNVSGRLDADFENATLAEALAALKTAGIAPLAIPAGNYKGEPISMSFHDADARDVVAMLAQVTGRKLSTPPAARVSVFATDEPWDRLLAGIAAAPRSKDSEATPARQWWNIKPDDLTARDLTPAGVASTAEGWIGLAYAPGRRLYVLKPDTTLGKVRVGAISANGITLN